MRIVQCPNCQKPVEWSPAFPFRPFCSERCRWVDLGAWADGSYAIPTKSELHTVAVCDVLPMPASDED